MSAKPAKASLRCAIYTRKSSEEGLDQAFNSLHAQREACEAYVKSQVGEGWVVHPEVYDDGGISGGTMERPALRRLLADVDQGVVDVVVVYKVDRLTRSLMDFAKIVDRFDARSVSFVSVTQAFNTTNSMGRLTLNVLLSFAQFEREVTGERIRDKIAASKAKGMWMGGNPPLGYSLPTDPLTRALIVHPADADTARMLFERYLALGSVHGLKAELDATGVVTRVHVSRSGTARGGVPYSRGALFHLFRNRTYLGEIVHGTKSYPGAHPAIIHAETFDAVQVLMDANGQTRRKRREMPDGSPLAGLIVDADGISMTPAMAYGRLGRKYRYYVSQPLQVGRANALDREVVRRVAAGAIEGLVMGKLTETSLLADDGWKAARKLILKVQLGRAEIVISVRKGELGPSGVASVREGLPQGHKLVEVGGKSPRLDLVIPGRPVFRGGRTWMASADGAPVAVRPKADPVLFKALKRAHQIIVEHHISPTTERHEYRLARGVDDSYLRSIAGLAFLAPDIQAAIVEGRQPAGLTLESLQQITLPLTWAEQRAALGFPA